MSFDDDWDAVMDDLADAFAGTVTLHRGRYSVDVDAQYWDRDYEGVSPQGLPITIVGRDWLIHTTDYNFDGEAVQPRDGDRFVAGGRTWEVLSPHGKRAWELHGADWLVHTKEVA